MKTKDLGEIGQMLTDVVGELKTLDVEEEKGIFSVFRKNGNRLANMKAKYEKAESEHLVPWPPLVSSFQPEYT